MNTDNTDKEPIENEAENAVNGIETAEELSVEEQLQEELAKEYEEFSNRLKKTLPKTKLVYLAIRPSLSRIAIVEKQKQFNYWLEKYCKSEKNRYFLDMHSPFYLTDGSVMQDIFISDRLHLNDKGYQIFSSIIRTFILKKLLEGFIQYSDTPGYHYKPKKNKRILI